MKEKRTELSGAGGCDYIHPSLPMKMIRNWALGLLLLCLAPGCSSFHREWRAAGRNPVQPGALTGRWEGTWQNTNNTHRDRLRAIITQTQPGTYRAFFHARYKRVLTFSYAVPLTQQGVEGDRTLFRGEADRKSTRLNSSH